MSKPILIAYFSRSGNNYLDGGIHNLPVGNTETVAKKIKDLARKKLAANLHTRRQRNGEQ